MFRSPELNIYEELDKILGNNLATNYLLAYDDFVKQDFPFLYAYYANGSQNANKPLKVTISNLNYLLQFSAYFNTQIEIHKESLQRTEYWELLIIFEKMHTRLLTIKNTDKWTRSSAFLNTNIGGVNGLLVTNGILPNQNIQDIIRKNTNTTDSDNDWVQLAIDNDLSEDEYGIDKNASLTYIKPFTTQKSYLRSVVDNMDGEKMLGKDIQKYLRFVNNDLATLSYTDTFEQSVDILTGLEIGDVPEFPDLGYESIVGNTINTSRMLLPSIWRKLKSTFDTDDSISEFTQTNVSFKDDSLYIDFTVKSTLGVILDKTVKI